MGLMDDIGASLNDLGRQAGQVARTGGKQIDLTALQSQIKDGYASLGQAVYVKRANGAMTLDGETEQYAAAVDALRVQEAQIKAEIEAVKAPQRGTPPATG